MSNLLSRFVRSWEKNWPELRGALTGTLPAFVTERSPHHLRGVIPVFCFHDLDYDAFREDLLFLRKNDYHTVVADELLMYLRGERPLPNRSVVLTIDDGARSLHDVAWPLLREFGFRAVAFICPGIHVAADDEAFANAVQRPCKWSELRAMHDSGEVDIQSHTYSHRHVPRWPTPIELARIEWPSSQAWPGDGLTLKEDFALARATIEQQLKKHVRHLCFPRFDFTDVAIQTGLDVGYETFWCGMLPASVLSAEGHPATFCIQRISGEYLRRLPGRGRLPLTSILRRRYAAKVRQRSDGKPRSAGQNLS